MATSFQSVWSPLNVPAFRSFWIGMSLSTTAFWMQNIAVTWMMRDWTDGDPVMVSLVQSALFLPVMLLSLPAGAISDMFDRKRLLIYSQVWMMAAPLGLAILILLDIRSVTALLVTTLFLAVGNSLKLPSQSALMPSLIDKDRLPMAVGLTSMAVNGGRIVGPALAGVFLPVIGATALFIGNSALYLLYIAVLFALPNAAARPKTTGRSLNNVFAELARYTAQTPTYAHILLRGGIYFCAWATVLALVPLLTETAEMFGTLYGLFGLGAVVGASFYGRLSSFARRNNAITVGIASHAIAIGALSLTSHFIIMAGLMFALGVASFYVMTTLQVSAQSQLPDDIRGRGLALMTTVFMGATAIASPLWGSLAAAASPQFGLAAAAVLSTAAALALHRLKIDVE